MELQCVTEEPWGGRAEGRVWGLTVEGLGIWIELRGTTVAPQQESDMGKSVF